MSVIEKILSNAKSTPQKIAIYDKESAISYGKLAEDIGLVAFQLQQQVSKGDFVIITASNTYAFIVVYFGIHYAGATAVNLSPDMDANQKSIIHEKVNPSLTIENCDSFLQGTMGLALKDSEQVVEESGFADLMFTSGTTGEPKGVLLLHKQLLLATEHIIEQVKNTSQDVELLLMPLEHSFAMARMRTTLYAGGTLVIGYPLQRLKGVFKALEKYKITGTGLVPSAWNFITKMSKDLITKYADQLNYIEFGSAFLPVEDKEQLIHFFPNTHLVMHYGLTEVSRATFIDLHHDPLEAVGKKTRGADFVIFNGDATQVRDGEEGEIALKAPWMLSGYYQNQELTAESFSDGYFKTGDLGKVEGEYLYLTGRLKEIINVGGKKVSPYTVERILNEHSGVDESICTPCFDADMGEFVQAFVLLKPEENQSFEHIVSELKEEVTSQLPQYMRPTKYTQVNSLPKTATGKLQRQHLAFK